MPKKDYNALELSQDAVKFAGSRFGKHYLSRLKKLREGHLAHAMDMALTDSYRANSASKASAVDAEIEFFQIAQTIQNTPSLLKRLRDKLMPKEVKDV